MAVHCSDELRQWLEQVTGGQLMRAEQPTAGASREAWIIDCERNGDTLKLFCLRDKQGNGSAKDAAVLSELAKHGIPVPEVIAEDSEQGLILLKRIEGDSTLEQEHRDEVGAHLMQVCAALHSIPVEQLNIPHLSTPASQQAGIVQQLAQIEQAIGALGEQAHPLFHAGLKYLQQHIPSSEAPFSLVHSDMGPGNFLHNGKQVLAVLDWEIAHYGDAKEDLAALAVRDMATPIGALAPKFSVYTNSTGRPVDIDRIAYFRLLILIRNSTMITLGLKYPPADFDHLDMTRYQALLMRAAALCLCDVLGVERPELEQASTAGNRVHNEQAASALSQAMQRQLEQMAVNSEGLAKRQAQDLKAALLDISHAQGSAKHSDELIDAAILKQLKNDEPLNTRQWQQLAVKLVASTHEQCLERANLMGELFHRLPQALPQR